MGDAPSIYENGIYRVGDVRLSDLSGRKRLPIGNSTFITTVQNSVFIDKSMLIADVLDGPFTATLFCRPRRFGKSLNLSMLHRFLEIPSPSDPAAMDTTPLFSGLAIWEGEEGYYRQHHGAYPVIRFSFNDTKGLEWETSYGMIAANIAAEYGRHRYVLEGDVPENERATFERILSQSASEAEVRSSLVLLSHMLFRHHGARVVILIDEYDAPVMAGYTYDYYTEVVDFLKGWLTGALKDNEALAFACLTGVQRISKESIFSDLNNLGVNTALNVVSDERYGFTDAEVAALAQYLGRGDAMAEARRWYDGYRFGAVDVYNPWSVLNFFQSGCVPDVYWGNTSGNGVLGDMVAGADADTLASLYALMEPGGAVEAPLDLSVVFPDLGVRPEALWSMLYLAGYLTTDDTSFPNDVDKLRLLKIPNQEVAKLYRGEIIERFALAAGGRDRLRELHRALVAGDAGVVASELESVLLRNASAFDLTSENSYHMLLMGLLFGVPGYGDPRSNREAGRGRFDIQLVPSAVSAPLVTVELKWAREAGAEQLAALADEALAQIADRAYDSEGDGRIVRYGIAFSGKSVAVAVEDSVV